ncbi:hypothetical protein QQY66_34130 [Streptomyces sp. DG2A-72]|uniref:hypothetical protein n=1 Tax=Streptomyces sp. DG2A-72 TaxID=3051386 RepID=UPI00265C7B0A|nr:hypothetical protein [Streptomyces sp. DG2A-72]MDO0936499.1 hypothetical protein [Streptomyces sp. DG2A-72]
MQLVKRLPQGLWNIATGTLLSWRHRALKDIGGRDERYVGSSLSGAVLLLEGGGVLSLRCGDGSAVGGFGLSVASLGLYSSRHQGADDAQCYTSQRSASAQ